MSSALDEVLGTLKKWSASRQLLLAQRGAMGARGVIFGDVVARNVVCNREGAIGFGQLI